MVLSSVRCIISALFQKHFLIQKFETDREITEEYSDTPILSLAHLLLLTCEKEYINIYS